MRASQWEDPEMKHGCSVARKYYLRLCRFKGAQGDKRGNKGRVQSEGDAGDEGIGTNLLYVVVVCNCESVAKLWWRQAVSTDVLDAVMVCLVTI